MFDTLQYRTRIIYYPRCRPVPHRKGGAHCLLRLIPQRMLPGAEPRLYRRGRTRVCKQLRPWVWRDNGPSHGFPGGSPMRKGSVRARGTPSIRCQSCSWVAWPWPLLIRVHPPDGVVLVSVGQVQSRYIKKAHQEGPSFCLLLRLMCTS
jgi:hypothetical protein